MMAAPTPTSSTASRFFAFLPKLCWILFALYILLSIILNVCVAPFIQYRFKWALSSLGFIMLPLGLVLGVACGFLARKMKRPAFKSSFLRAHSFGAFVALGTVILLGVQGVVIKGALFMGSDIDWAIMMSFNEPQTLSAYYSIYPNNHFLGGIYMMAYRAGAALGVNPLVLEVCGGWASITASICLGTFVARKLGGSACGICSFLLMAVFVGLNPKLLVPYSDAYSMVFTTLTLFLYVHVKHPVKWPLMTLVAYVGYSIKPTAFAILLAAAFVSACLWVAQWLRARKAQKGANGTGEGASKPVCSPTKIAHRIPGAARFALAALGCVVALGLGMFVTTAVKDQVGVRTYPDEAVVPAHYLMMGFNTEHDGMYNSEDINYSWQYHSREEMTEADLAVWAERVRTLGPGGIAELLVKKNLITYNNGDLMFYRASPLAFHEILGDSAFIQQFYGIETTEEDVSETEDAPVPPWAYPAQALWFLILAGIALGLANRKPQAAECVMALTLLLLSGFLLLFECNASYLYLYAPFYVVLAVRGWQTLGRIWTHWRAHKALTAKDALGSTTPDNA